MGDFKPQSFNFNADLKRYSRLEMSMKGRSIARFKRLSAVRNVSDDLEDSFESKANADIENNMETQPKPDSRLEKLMKWKEEKKLRKEQQQKNKPRPFYAGSSKIPLGNSKIPCTNISSSTKVPVNMKSYLKLSQNVKQLHLSNSRVKTATASGVSKVNPQLAVETGAKDPINAVKMSAKKNPINAVKTSANKDTINAVKMSAKKNTVSSIKTSAKKVPVSATKISAKKDPINAAKTSVKKGPIHTVNTSSKKDPVNVVRTGAVYAVQKPISKDVKKNPIKAIQKPTTKIASKNLVQAVQKPTTNIASKNPVRTMQKPANSVKSTLKAPSTKFLKQPKTPGVSSSSMEKDKKSNSKVEISKPAKKEMPSSCKTKYAQSSSDIFDEKFNFSSIADVSGFQPRKSFAPPDFKFNPPVGLQFLDFEKDVDELNFHLSQMNCLSRTSTPTRDSTERLSSKFQDIKNFKDCNDRTLEEINPSAVVQKEFDEKNLSDTDEHTLYVKFDDASSQKPKEIQPKSNAGRELDFPVDRKSGIYKSVLHEHHELACIAEDTENETDCSPTNFKLSHKDENKLNSVTEPNTSSIHHRSMRLMQLIDQSSELNQEKEVILDTPKRLGLRTTPVQLVSSIQNLEVSPKGSFVESCALNTSIICTQKMNEKTEMKTASDSSNTEISTRYPPFLSAVNLKDTFNASIIPNCTQNEYIEQKQAIDKKTEVKTVSDAPYAKNSSKCHSFLSPIKVVDTFHPRRSPRLQSKVSSGYVNSKSKEEKKPVLSEIPNSVRNVASYDTSSLISYSGASSKIILTSQTELEDASGSSKTGLTARFSKLRLYSNENADPELKLVDIENTSEVDVFSENFKPKKLSLLYSPRRMSIRKSIRGDLMTFSPNT